MNNVVLNWIKGIRKQALDKRAVRAAFRDASGHNQMLAQQIRRLKCEITHERTMRQMWQERYYALAKITREVIEEHERSIIDTDAWENENENHA